MTMTDRRACASGRNYAVELDDDAYGIYNFNWGYYLESLRLYCTTGMGQPFPAARRQTA